MALISLTLLPRSHRSLHSLTPRTPVAPRTRPLRALTHSPLSQVAISGTVGWGDMLVRTCPLRVWHGAICWCVDVTLRVWARGDMLVCKCHLACVGPGPGTTDAWMYARSPVCEGGDENATKKGEILSGCDRGPSLESSRHGSEYI